MSIFFNPSQRFYIILVVLFCLLLMLSNLIGTKFFFLPFAPELPLTSSLITYPLTFLISDLVTEIYGSKQARFMIFLSFGCSLLMLCFVQTILNLPHHDYWHVEGNPYGFTSSHEYQNAFRSVFGISHIVLLSSMAAFLCAQIVDVAVFSRVKQWTEGRHLFLRNNLSTWAGQLIDTAVVNSLVLYGGLHFEFSKGLEVMGSCFLMKVVIAILETPLLYLAVFYARKKLRPSTALS
jgi:hypothetical protein